MCSALRNGDNHSPVPAQGAKERPSGGGVAHLPEVLPTSQPLGFFLPDTKHRGRKEGGISAPTDLPELCIPLPGVSMPCVSMFSAVG